MYEHTTDYTCFPILPMGAKVHCGAGTRILNISSCVSEEMCVCVICVSVC